LATNNTVTISGTTSQTGNASFSNVTISGTSAHTGNASFGNVAASGVITATGAITATGGFVVGATAAPAFSAYNSNNQSIADSTTTKIQFNTEFFDTNSNFDNATNYRFTPTVAGYYSISAIASLSTLANTGGTNACIYKNGSLYIQGAAVGTANMYPTASVSSIIYFNGSTDYVELYVFNGTGGASNLMSVSYLTAMSGCLVRAA